MWLSGPMSEPRSLVFSNPIAPIPPLNSPAVAVIWLDTPASEGLLPPIGKAVFCNLFLHHYLLFWRVKNRLNRTYASPASQGFHSSPSRGDRVNIFCIFACLTVQRKKSPAPNEFPTSFFLANCHSIFLVLFVLPDVSRCM